MQEFKGEIANRLRQCRKEKGWTIDEAVKQLGIGISTYSNWEQGIRKPRLEMFVPLANMFDTTPAYLACFVPHKSRDTGPRNLVNTNYPAISIKGKAVDLDSVANNCAYEMDYIKSRFLNENKLISIVASDSTMSPVIKKGDELLIDRTATTVTKSDLFAILVNKQVWIRWIRPEISGGFTLVAEDKAQYQDTILSQEELDNLAIIGRVIRISRDR